MDSSSGYKNTREPDSECICLFKRTHFVLQVQHLSDSRTFQNWSWTCVFILLSNVYISYRYLIMWCLFSSPMKYNIIQKCNMNYDAGHHKPIIGILFSLYILFTVYILVHYHGNWSLWLYSVAASPKQGTINSSLL